MKYRAALLLALASLSACSGGPQGPRNFEPKIANPSAIVTAEIAFNRLAQEKGQWTAFREYAAKEATMFVPEPVDAQTWLKGRADPAVAVKWQPHKAFMSCDGKTGVTTGAWQKNGATGYFTTVWQYIEKKPGEGEWKWVVDSGDELKSPREPGEWITTKTASCKGRAPANLMAPPEGAKMKVGYSRDQSLSYTWVVTPDGARTLKVDVWNGEEMEQVLSDSIAASK